METSLPHPMVEIQYFWSQYSSEHLLRSKAASKKRLPDRLQGFHRSVNRRPWRSRQPLQRLWRRRVPSKSLAVRPAKTRSAISRRRSSAARRTCQSGRSIRLIECGSTGSMPFFRQTSLWPPDGDPTEYARALEDGYPDPASPTLYRRCDLRGCSLLTNIAAIQLTGDP